MAIPGPAHDHQALIENSVKAGDGNHIDANVNPGPQIFSAKSWLCEMQLTKFRASVKSIADDYLKDQNVKFSW